MKTVWSEQLYNQIAKKSKKMLALYSSVGVLWLAFCVVNLLFSKEDYLPYLITNIVLTILFSWFSIYFFTIPYAEVSSYQKLYKSMKNSLEKSEIFTYNNQQADRTKESICFKVYSFSEGKSEREVFSLISIDFEIGKTYQVCTLKNIIISYEVQDE